MTDATVWQPAASLATLKSRAELLAYVRGFFARRRVMEVETPVLGRFGVTDLNLDGIRADVAACGVRGGWLQTSPEYHMKRLLAAGAGPIFQVARVFRDGESGPRHNPEFSLLEWYRPGMNDRELMAEVGDLVCGWLECPQPDVLTYRDALMRHAGFDPMAITDAELRQYCQRWLEPRQLAELGRDACLDLVMSFAVEPALGQDAPVFVTRYPASQAALARTSWDDGYAVAHRFELYSQGLELCNGYWELTDVAEQRARFEADNRTRRAAGKPEMAIDETLVAAMESGLPDCAGVALGLDRLLMLGVGARSIDEVLAFPFGRA